MKNSEIANIRGRLRLLSAEESSYCLWFLFASLTATTQGEPQQRIGRALDLFACAVAEAEVSRAPEPVDAE